MVDTVLTNRRPLAIFLTSLFVLLIFMSYQVTDVSTGRTFLGNVLFRVFSPVQLFLSASYRSVANVVQNYVTLSNASNENQELKKQLTELKIHLANSAHEERENQRLRALLKLTEQMPYSVLAAEVVARDARILLSETITINRGANHGVREEMPVVTPEGVIGMVVQTTNHASRVQIITDRSSAIGAMLQKDRTSGILEGVGGNICLLRFLPGTADIRKGDVVVTSGQDGIFPEGLLIGVVDSLVQESKFYRDIGPQAQFYKTAQIRPSQNFSSLKEVVLLLTTPKPAPPVQEVQTPPLQKPQTQTRVE